jgi:hypothetical protein
MHIYKNSLKHAYLWHNIIGEDDTMKDDPYRHDLARRPPNACLLNKSSALSKTPYCNSIYLLKEKKDMCVAA